LSLIFTIWLSGLVVAYENPVFGKYKGNLARYDTVTCQTYSDRRFGLKTRQMMHLAGDIEYCDQIVARQAIDITWNKTGSAELRSAGTKEQKSISQPFCDSKSNHFMDRV
jgi:hypothetical protein